MLDTIDLVFFSPSFVFTVTPDSNIVTSPSPTCTNPTLKSSSRVLSTIMLMSVGDVLV